MIHNLKIWPEWFSLVVLRKKEFELRFNDRNFQPGDTLRLMEFTPLPPPPDWDAQENGTFGEFTGRVGIGRVTCVLSDMPGLQPGYVAMGVFFLQLETKHTAPEDENDE